MFCKSLGQECFGTETTVLSEYKFFLGDYVVKIAGTKDISVNEVICRK
jgi:hypothetical protein